MFSHAPKVHFLDIKSRLPGSLQSWSPNTMKTRILLNYKRIPYQQSFISYPDIADALKSSRFPLYSGPFTLPAICPPSSSPITPQTDECLPTVDSLAIAQELDARFPSNRQAFPTQAAYALALAVQAVLVSSLRTKGLNLWIRYIPQQLDERGAEYFVRTRESAAQFGKPLAEIGTPDDRAKDLEDLLIALKPITQMLDPSSLHRKDAPDSPFLLGGEQPTYADFIILGFLAWAHRAEVAAGEMVEPKGGWFDRMLQADGGVLGKLWVAGSEWVEGQGEDVEWKA